MNLDALIKQASIQVRESQEQIDIVAEFNVNKVLHAFRKYKVSDVNLQASTGYGYNDVGRETLEKVFADVFKAEDAIVRHQIVSGTHAIALCYFGNLLPGDELVVLGKPYDTLRKVIGANEKSSGSLRELGIAYREIPVTNGNVVIETIVNSLGPKTKMLSIQRSKGYEWSPSLTINDIERIAQAVKQRWPQVIIFVDNCYGEFVETKEPLEVGADLIAGSLIKNPGGGIAPGGGYVAGRADLVERAAMRLTAPGIGRDVGPTLGNSRLMYQGLFYAPHIVSEALAGAVFTSNLFSLLGFEVLPGPTEYRTDIIQAIKLGTRARVLAFCRAVQKFSPVDSHVTPEPWDMPGYGDPVIMAAGAFVQGSSIELSADAPMREPYIVFTQGGISKYHVRLAMIETLSEMIKYKLI